MVLFSAAFETHYGRSETTRDCVQVRSWQLAYQSPSRQGRELWADREGSGREASLVYIVFSS